MIIPNSQTSTGSTLRLALSNVKYSSKSCEPDSITVADFNEEIEQKLKLISNQELSFQSSCNSEKKASSQAEDQIRPQQRKSLYQEDQQSQEQQFVQQQQFLEQDSDQESIEYDEYPQDYDLQQNTSSLSSPTAQQFQKHYMSLKMQLETELQRIKQLNSGLQPMSLEWLQIKRQPTQNILNFINNNYFVLLELKGGKSRKIGQQSGCSKKESRKCDQIQSISASNRVHDSERMSALNKNIKRVSFHQEIWLKVFKYDQQPIIINQTQQRVQTMIMYEKPSKPSYTLLLRQARDFQKQIQARPTFSHFQEITKKRQTLEMESKRIVSQTEKKVSFLATKDSAATSQLGNCTAQSLQAVIYKQHSQNSSSSSSSQVSAQKSQMQQQVCQMEPSQNNECYFFQQYSIWHEPMEQEDSIQQQMLEFLQPDSWWHIGEQMEIQ